MFTRIEQGTEHYPKTETDLTALIRSVCEDMRIIAEKDITVTEQLEPVTANVNREMLTLLTVNLIQNALRYGRENGFVKVKLSESEDMAVITVEDNVFFLIIQFALTQRERANFYLVCSATIEATHVIEDLVCNPRWLAATDNQQKIVSSHPPIVPKMFKSGNEIGAWSIEPRHFVNALSFI
jgi:hypothetical protein